MRRVPRAFFWIDQQVIRSGLWMRLSPGARLTYVALAASVDRQGVSQWSRRKLMDLSGCEQVDVFDGQLRELEELRLVVLPSEGALPEIRVLNVETAENATGGGMLSPTPAGKPSFLTSAPRDAVVVHTQTTIHFGGQSRAEPGSSS